MAVVFLTLLPFLTLPVKSWQRGSFEGSLRLRLDLYGKRRKREQIIVHRYTHVLD
jgi:hypothetical protein